jgi:DNA primase
LILEEGMNVKVCTFPDGEDPDSFAKTSYEDLVLYLENNARFHSIQSIAFNE